MMNIEIYSKSQCPFCDYAKAKAENLKSYGIAEYKVFELGKDFDREKVIRRISLCKNIPTNKS
jgi:glutaredoxin